MKKTIFLSLLFTLIAFYTEAQNDTMYIMKNGVVVGKYNVNNQIDSLIYYNPFAGTFTDSRDGNTYNWVKIGAQTWMAQDLKYLPSVVGQTTGSFSFPYYYVYGYNGTNVTEAKATTNYNTYGVLYNWPAAMAGAPSSNSNPSGVQGVCPTGWHLPSDAEWSQLTTFLGGASVAGGKLKATTLWNSPNLGATNETGFTGLPSGVRHGTSYFIENGRDVIYWSSTQNVPGNVWEQNLNFSSNALGRSSNYNDLGFSVRCVKN